MNYVKLVYPPPPPPPYKAVNGYIICMITDEQHQDFALLLRLLSKLLISCVGTSLRSEGITLMETEFKTIQS